MQQRLPLSAPFTAEAIANAVTLRGGLDISTDGTQVVYGVRSLYKPPEEEHTKAAVWIAALGEEACARQLTSGNFNDTAAVFSPDGQSIVFLSDRHKAGGKAQIYALPLSAGGEAIALTSASSKKAVTAFEFSPDGKYIAFTSEDEPTEEDERREKLKDDAVVWSDRKKGHSRLRLLRVATRSISTFSLPSNVHVKEFTWNDDSAQLVVSTAQHERIEAEAFESIYFVVSVHNLVAEPVHRATSKDGHGSGLVWLANDTLLELRYHDPASPISCQSLQRVEPKNSHDRVVYSGVEDDAGQVLSLRSESRVVVEVISGLDSRLEVVDSSGKCYATLFETNDDAIANWTVQKLKDGTYAVAVIKSSGPRKEVSNLWTGITDGSKPVALNRASSHLQEFADIKTDIQTEAFYWEARDGTKLDGVISKPANAQGKLPTLLVVHGGPYGRNTLAYDFYYSGWGIYLAAIGFCCISPNYRGSAGRGAAFAETQQSGVGTLDWTDCEDMLKATLDRGIADKERLGICGWSQGGFMTAWGVSQTKNLFKAGVMGAGVSDWGAMATESDVPEFEAGLGGSPPWDMTKDRRNDPINHVKDVETAVLIIHGEQDKRVPVGQAVGFYRGLRRMSKYPDRQELVVYPREPHGFTEKTHAQDVLKRVMDHFVTWLL